MKQSEYNSLAVDSIFSAMKQKSIKWPSVLWPNQRIPNNASVIMFLQVSDFFQCFSVLQKPPLLTCDIFLKAEEGAITRGLTSKGSRGRLVWAGAFVLNWPRSSANSTPGSTLRREQTDLLYYRVTWSLVKVYRASFSNGCSPCHKTCIPNVVGRAFWCYLTWVFKGRSFTLVCTHLTYLRQWCY